MQTGFKLINSLCSLPKWMCLKSKLMQVESYLMLIQYHYSISFHLAVWKAHASPGRQFDFPSVQRPSCANWFTGALQMDHVKRRLVWHSSLLSSSTVEHPEWVQFTVQKKSIDLDTTVNWCHVKDENGVRLWYEATQGNWLWFTGQMFLPFSLTFTCSRVRLVCSGTCWDEGGGAKCSVCTAIETVIFRLIVKRYFNIVSMYYGHLFHNNLTIIAFLFEDTRCSRLNQRTAAMLMNWTAPLSIKHPGRAAHRPLLAARSCELLIYTWNNAEHPSFSI